MAAAAAAVLSQIDLNNTIGVGFVGACITSMLFGITCLQAVQYYRSQAAQNDRFLWYYVAWLTVLDTAHQVLILQTFYHYTITHFDDPLALLKNYPLIGVSLLLTPLSDFFCQLFYIWRIWKLSRENKYLTGFCTLIGLLHFAFQLDMPIRTIRIPELLVAETSLQKIGIASLSLTLFKEFVYVYALSYLLVRSRTGFKKTDSIITKLIVIVISTGGFTIAIDFAGLIAYIVSPTTLFVFMFQMLLPKLLVNAVLTSLNLRSFVQQAADRISEPNFALSTIPPNTLSTMVFHRGSSGDIENDGAIMVTDPKSISISMSGQRNIELEEDTSMRKIPEF
ncbi:hypothetical protein C8Q75DRAFT_806369 [Abortiporus biennis]|nr:hypothetical protein C8Q75DRAFT_806369 [Abortiporus biennis]